MFVLQWELCLERKGFDVEMAIGERLRRSHDFLRMMPQASSIRGLNIGISA
jgi:hypothetical protein